MRLSIAFFFFVFSFGIQDVCHARFNLLGDNRVYISATVVDWNDNVYNLSDIYPQALSFSRLSQKLFLNLERLDSITFQQPKENSTQVENTLKYITLEDLKNRWVSVEVAFTTGETCEMKLNIGPVTNSDNKILSLEGYDSTMGADTAISMTKIKNITLIHDGTYKRCPKCHFIFHNFKSDKCKFDKNKLEVLKK